MDYNEKRTFRRMMMQCEMDIQHRQSQDKFKGTCLDLSGNGLLLETETQLEEGDCLSISIPSTNTRLVAFTAEIIVRRCMDKTYGCEITLEEAASA